jgi:hypothetical protein
LVDQVDGEELMYGLSLVVVVVGYDTANFEVPIDTQLIHVWN